MNKSLSSRHEENFSHLLDLNHVSADLLEQIFTRAASYIHTDTREIIKSTEGYGRTITLLFFEPSTRTKTTFEIAAKRLGCDVVSLAVPTSSISKGESLLDTINNLIAMQMDALVVRHPHSGAAHLIAETFGHKIAVINAGDGCHAHPSQALLDLYTMRHFKKDFHALKVAIVGDILHSRVARSNIQALNIMGAQEIRVIGPCTLLPTSIEKMGAQVYYDLDTGIRDVDVIMMLRLQAERMNRCFLPSENEFFQYYGLTPEKLSLAKPDALVMHPGPMNRGIEIDSRVADGPHSVILQQVHFGIAIRMAIISLLLEKRAATRGKT